MKTSRLSLPLALALAAAVSASPVLAQGTSGKGHGRGKQEQRDNRGNRDRDRDDDRFSRRDRDDDDDDRRFSRSSTWGGHRWELSRAGRTLRRDGRRVPPGWCIGRGNPHNTRENCGGWRWDQRRTIWDWIGIGSRDDRRWDDRRRDDGRWDDRWDTRRSGSVSSSHAEFHRWHDQRCRQLAAQAGTNLRRLVEVRAICKAEHDDWHRRTGTRH
jgi:hypothetical protein